MQLEVGKAYRQRNGGRVDVNSKEESDTDYQFSGRDDYGDMRSYCADGRYWSDPRAESPLDLVALWDEPAVTAPVTESPCLCDEWRARLTKANLTREQRCMATRFLVGAALRAVPPQGADKLREMMTDALEFAREIEL